MTQQTGEPDAIIQATHLPWDTIGTESVAAREPEPVVPADPGLQPSRPVRSTGAWTIPAICVGVALIASCILIPAADENRRLAYEATGLRADLEQLQRQEAINDAFLKRVSDDPALSERLAQRQMKMVREGTSVLELKGEQLRSNPSPFVLTTLPPPDPLPEYRPVVGRFAELCRHPRTQLYMLGGGLLMIAVGLVLSHGQD